MGYSTKLYAVDLQQLQSAVGSQDRTWIERVESFEKAEGVAEAEVDPTKGPRVKVAKNSDIFLNGRLISWEDFQVAIVRPEWKGSNLYAYQERADDVIQRADGSYAVETGKGHSGMFREVGSFAAALYRLPNDFSICWCNSEEELSSGWQEDEISDEQALREVIGGDFSDPACAHQYGYALERLCHALGDHLATIEGKGRLRALKIDTPLAKERSPVALPRNDDFPYISYLTEDEVQREVQRLRSTDLSYPKNAEIESDRRELFQCLDAAAAKHRAVVSFYY
jgi:hypothetical protein